MMLGKQKVYELKKKFRWSSIGTAAAIAIGMDIIEAFGTVALIVNGTAALNSKWHGGHK